MEGIGPGAELQQLLHGFTLVHQKVLMLFSSCLTKGRGEEEEKEEEEERQGRK